VSGRSSKDDKAKGRLKEAAGADEGRDASSWPGKSRNAYLATICGRGIQPILQVLRLFDNEVYNAFRPGIECAKRGGFVQ